MPIPTIDQVWSRIVACEGETFCQMRGGEFRFEVVGKGLRLDRTNQTLPKSIIGQALQRVPLENTTAVLDLRGPSYLYAILMDPRVRGADW